MNIRSAIYLLAHSSNPEDKREWTVLYWKSQGLKHEEIAIKLGYSIKWVQRYMTSAYKRFEAPLELDKFQKLEYLEKNVFPLMREFIANEPDSVKELPPPPSHPVPPEEPEQGVVPTSNRAIIPPKQEIIIIDKQTKWVKIFRRILFTIVSILIVLVVGYVAFNAGRGATPEPVVLVITATPIPATETPLSTATSAIPTETPTAVPTNTQAPTITPTPTEFVPPADGILFQDNFESGDLSAWTQVSGQWIVNNGQLTQLGDEGDYFNWISLKRPEWKNYIVSVDMYQPFQGSAAQDESAIAVRVTGSQSQFFGVVADYFGEIYWANIGGGRFDIQEISGTNRDYDFYSGSRVELEVNGDTYILRVNGLELQKITISGASNGGISLGAICYRATGKCASFDNVKVTYLP